MVSERNEILRKITHSKYIDIVGVFLVLVICLYQDFHETVYFQGKIQFGIPVNRLWSMIQSGAFPIGILSIIGAIVSLLASRMIVKQKNLGNFIGIFTTINSGIIDYLFGNHSAVITYPLTFFIAILATKRWYNGERIRKYDVFYVILVLASFVVAYSLVFLGFHFFGTGIKSELFKHSVAIIFGLSLIGNVSTAFKYEQTFLTWSIYNIVQIVKNAIQGNLANIVKYVFYLGNAVLTYFDWRINGDVIKS